MKNIFTHFTSKKLKESLITTFERLPLSILFAVMGFGIIVTEIAIGDSLSNAIQNIIGKSFITLVVLFVLSIAVYLFSESRKESSINVWRNQLFTLVFGILFYLSFEENLFNNFYSEIFVHIALIIVGVIAAVFIAPFVKKFFSAKSRLSLSQRAFYTFTYDTILAIMMAFIVATVTMFLGFLAYWSIDTLFGLPYSFDDFYAYWSAFTAIILGPVFFLTNLAKADTVENTHQEDDKFFAFLIKYIGLPAITLYFVILYAYTLKVLINFTDWPKGQVAWMVIGFSFLGYLVYTAAYALTKPQKGAAFAPAVTFRKVFPYAVLPQVIMLFYAIGLRINQYDITINRYFVVAFGILLAMLSVYFIFSHKKYLGMIPALVIVFIGIISIGPWSVYSLPEARQINQLEMSLHKAAIMSTSKGRLVTPLLKKSAITKELSGEIYSSIDYMCNYHGCDSLDGLLGEQLRKARAEDKEQFEQTKKEDIERAEKGIRAFKEKKAEQKEGDLSKRDAMRIKRLEEDVKRAKERTYSEISTWVLKTSLVEQLNVAAYYGRGITKADVPEYINLVTKARYAMRDAIVDVSGYDYYMPIENNDSDMFMHRAKFAPPSDEVKKNAPKYQAIFDTASQTLKIHTRDADAKSVVFESFDITSRVKALLEKTDDDSENEYGQREFSREELTFVMTGQKLRVKMSFRDISVQNPAWKATEEARIDDMKIPGDFIAVPQYGGMYANGHVLIHEL